MTKKIVKFCGEILIAFTLACLLWYLVLMQIPDDPVLGKRVPAATKEEVMSLMRYHGTKAAYIEDGEWFFDRDGEVIRLRK